MHESDSEPKYFAGNSPDDKNLIKLYYSMQFFGSLSSGEFGFQINMTWEDIEFLLLVRKKEGAKHVECDPDLPRYLLKAVGTPEPESPSRTTTPTATPTAAPTTTPGNASSTTPGPSRNPNAPELSKVEIAALVIGLALALFLAILVFQYPRLRSANNRCTCV